MQQTSAGKKTGMPQRQSTLKSIPEVNPSFACAAWGWRDFPIPDYFQATATLGLRAVELNAHSGAPLHLSEEPNPSILEQIAAWAEEADVSVLCIAGHNDFTLADPKAQEEQLRNVRWFIDAAATLNAPFVRLLSGGHRNDAPTSEVFERLQRAFNTVGTYAEERDVLITIENHGGPTATGQRIVRLMEGIGSPAVGLNFDPANFLNQGTDPLTALRYIQPWINYSHWKDVRWVDKGPQFCAFGEGEIHWDPIFETLIDSGYRGYWTVEYEEPSDVAQGTLAGFENLRRRFAQTEGAL